MTPADIERIGRALYPDVSYAGKPAWQAWLADGLGYKKERRRRVREWLAGTAEVPELVAQVLAAAELLAAELALATLPRGTPIVERMASLVPRQ